MAKLGFLGLGLMGYPMARNLRRAGHEVAVWSNTTAKAHKLADAEKGRFCATPKEVAENADVLFLCVGDTAMSKEVILGANGIIEGVRSGSVVVDYSTIAISQSRHIGQALKAKGVDFLDAPCTGSTPGAESGNLTFMIGALTRQHTVSNRRCAHRRRVDGSGERDGSLQCGAACSTASPPAMCSQACCRQRKLKCPEGTSQSGKIVNVFPHG